MLLQQPAYKRNSTKYEKAKEFFKPSQIIYYTQYSKRSFKTSFKIKLENKTYFCKKSNTYSTLIFQREWYWKHFNMENNMIPFN